jgi:hypothetical protein
MGQNTNFKYKTAFFLKEVKRNVFLAPSGNRILEDGFSIDEFNKIQFEENRACFETEEEALIFVNEMDFDDEFKIFHQLEIVKGITIK